MLVLRDSRALVLALRVQQELQGLMLVLLDSRALVQVLLDSRALVLVLRVQQALQGLELALVLQGLAVLLCLAAGLLAQVYLLLHPCSLNLL